MLVDFDRGVVQHQGRLIYNVLGNQFLKNMLPNTLLAPSLEPGVHTFPRAIPLRPVPPLGSLYSASTISHWASSGCLFPAFLHALAFPAATGLSLFSTVPLSFHVVSFFYFIICLKTLSSGAGVNLVQGSPGVPGQNLRRDLPGLHQVPAQAVDGESAAADACSQRVVNHDLAVWQKAPLLASGRCGGHKEKRLSPDAFSILYLCFIQAFFAIFSGVCI